MWHPILLAELNRLMGGALPNGQYGGTRTVDRPVTGGGSGSGSSGSGSGSGGGDSTDDEADETIEVAADRTVTTTSTDDNGTRTVSVELPNGIRIETTQFAGSDRVAVYVTNPNGSYDFRLYDTDGNLRATGAQDSNGNYSLRGDGYTLTRTAEGVTTRNYRNPEGLQVSIVTRGDGSSLTERRDSDGELLYRRSVDTSGNGEVFTAQPDGLNVTLRIRVHTDADGNSRDEFISGTVDKRETDFWESASGAARSAIGWVVDQTVDMWNNARNNEPTEQAPQGAKDAVVQYKFDDKSYYITAIQGTSSAETIFGNGLLVGFDGSDTLIGGKSDDFLEGGSDSDVLDAKDGFNRLKGGSGDDRLYSGADGDLLDGGSGFDVVSYYKRETGVRVYLWDVSKNSGAAKDDVYKSIEVIDGTRFDDVLEGDGEANTFWGDAGHDRMKGGAGADTLSGGDGDDKLEGGTEADVLNGGNGRDTVSYAGAVTGVGVYLHNTALNTGDAAGDTFASIEVVDGSTHSDRLEGNGAANIFWGDAGHDALKGFAGTDTLSGGTGDDRLFGGEGADVLDGGEGYDFAVYSDAASGVLVDLLNTSRNTGEAYGDTYVAIEGVEGSALADQLYGTNGSDDFHGGGGDDQLEGRGGADQLVGGDGFDFAVYWGASSGVIANLTAGTGTQGDAAGDRFYGIEGLQGSNHADTLTGDGKGNTLYGWGGNDLLLGEGDIWTSGNDYIEGGDGADTISGGGGHDWLLGNAGRDVFRFDVSPLKARLENGASIAGIDTLADFNAAEDRIALETSVFGFARVTYDAWGSPVNGALSASAFKLGTAASTSAQRIVYDQASGALYFDADGVGGQAQVQFAKVNAGTALTAAHFQLFTL